MTDPTDQQQPATHRADHPGTAPTMLSSSDAEVPRTNNGASTSLRPPYGRSQAQAPAQGGGGAPARAPELEGVAAEGSRDHQEQPPATAPHVAAKPRAVRASAAAAARRKPKRCQRDTVQKKKSRVTVRFDQHEKQLLKEQAAAAGLSLAHLIARRALTAEGTLAVADARVEQLDAAIDELAATRSELSAWGNNLNQIARHLNTDGTLPSVPAGDFVTASAPLLETVRGIVERVDTGVFRIARRRGNS